MNGKYLNNVSYPLIYVIGFCCENLFRLTGHLKPTTCNSHLVGLMI